MKKLDKKDKVTEINVECREGERTLLSSNESDVRSPSLNFLDTSSENISEDMILEYLATIISDIYLKTYDKPAEENGSNLLQSFHEGTSGGRQ